MSKKILSLLFFSYQCTERLHSYPYYSKSADNIERTQECTYASENDSWQDTSWHQRLWGAIERNEAWCGRPTRSRASCSTTCQVRAVRPDWSRIVTELTCTGRAYAVSGNRVPERCGAVGRQAETCLCTRSNGLCRVWVIWWRCHSRASVASEEWEIREIAVAQQTILILRDSVADMLGGADLWGATFQGLDLIQLADWYRMPNPIKELFVGNDPDILLCLSPIQKSIDHLDSRVTRVNSRIGRGKMDRVSVKTNGLTHSIVMCRKSALHICKSRWIIDGRSTIGSIEPRVHQVHTSSAKAIEESIHGDLPEARKNRLSLTYARHG